jgi:hypothetical protein
VQRFSDFNTDPNAPTTVPQGLAERKVVGPLAQRRSSDGEAQTAGLARCVGRRFGDSTNPCFAKQQAGSSPAGQARIERLARIVSRVGHAACRTSASWADEATLNAAASRAASHDRLAYAGRSMRRGASRNAADDA